MNQVAVHGYAVNDVAERLGISTKTLFMRGLKGFLSQLKNEEDQDLRADNGLKRELKRLEQERNLLKEAAVFFAGESKKDTGL